MFVVIFRATVRQFDETYSQTAARMRELALTEFGCLGFHAVTEGPHEVSLSYWPDEAARQALGAGPALLRREEVYAPHASSIARPVATARTGSMALSCSSETLERLTEILSIGLALWVGSPSRSPR